MDCNITFVKGDTFAFAIELEELEQDIESAYFTVKESYDDDTPVLQKTLNNGITKLYGNDYSVRIAPEDTESLEARRYYYDLRIGVNGDVFTLIRGILWLKNSVTE